MNRIERLVQSYERQVALPWETAIAGPQRVWFVVYDKNDERRLRARIELFEIATKNQKHPWQLCDVTNTFGEWMAGQEYRDRYLQKPEKIEMAMNAFRGFVAGRVKDTLARADENTVTAVLGVSGLFGFLRVSDLMKDVETAARGRLIVFFPGDRDKNNYRLLDARDGWNYLAVPITAHDGDPSA